MLNTVDYVITTCGNNKTQGPNPAHIFYCGSFTRLQREVAKALNPRQGYLILSNKHGYLLPSDTVTGRYDSHWGYPDTLSSKDLKGMLGRLPFSSGDRVLCLGSREYAGVTRKLLPDSIHVHWLPKLLPDSRMGYQMKFYRAVCRHRALPRGWEGATELTREEVRRSDGKSHKAPEGWTPGPAPSWLNDPDHRWPVVSPFVLQEVAK